MNVKYVTPVKNWIVTGTFTSEDPAATRNCTNQAVTELIESKYSSDTLPKPSKTSCKWIMIEFNKLCSPNTCLYVSILNLNSNILGEYTNGQYSEITLPTD